MCPNLAAEQLPRGAGGRDENKVVQNRTNPKPTVKYTTTIQRYSKLILEDPLLPGPPSAV